MPSEIVSLQVGQCGNQVGQQYWTRLCAEHGISPHDGSKQSPPASYDQPDIFFNLSSTGRYTPRAILIDLEPGVIGKLPENGLFNPRNTYLSKEGSSSGNNWAYGYQYAHDHAQEVMDIVDHELDSCDSLQAFQLLHSVGGGTGSGAGSYLLEQLHDRYGSKKLLTTLSVFEGANSSVVVHPYNTILTLRRLIEHSDACVVFDNSSLHKIASECFVDTVSFYQINELIATAMTTLSNTLRFPSFLYTSLSSLLATLIPTPDFKFLSTSFSPFAADIVAGTRPIRSSTAYDVILNLLDPKLQMANQAERAPHAALRPAGPVTPHYLALLNILLLNNPTDTSTMVDQEDTHKALLRAHQRIRFAPWCSPSIHLAHGTKSPFLPSSPVTSGLMVANTTGVSQLFLKACSQFDSMFARKMFINNYTRNDMFSRDEGMAEEFRESREIVRSLVAEYDACVQDDYLDDGDEPM